MSVGPSRMRASDPIGLALSALGRQKARTALTILGAAIGTFALIASVAVGRGVDRAILGLFRGTDALRQIGLFVRYEGTAEGVPASERVVEGRCPTPSARGSAAPWPGSSTVAARRCRRPSSTARASIVSRRSRTSSGSRR